MNPRHLVQTCIVGRKGGRSFLAAACLILVGCEPAEEIFVSRGRFLISVSGLPRLEGGHYQILAEFATPGKGRDLGTSSYAGPYASLGRFNLSEDGSKLIGPDGRDARFEIPEGGNAQLIDNVILALQPDSLLASSLHVGRGSVIMGGRMLGDARMGVADLKLDHSDAFDSDLRLPTGTFTVTAPTSPPDSNSGVWFFENVLGIAPSLHDLPVLPPGWSYEGWLVDRTDSSIARYYSTGRFLRPDSADFDGPGPGAGPGQGMDFPGQDFITGAGGQPELPDVNYGPYVVAVTIEPEPDISPEPFFLQILNSSNQPVDGIQAPRILYNVVDRHTPVVTIKVVR